MKPADYRDSDGVVHHHSPEELHNEDVAHEHSDVNVRTLVTFAAGLATVVVGVAVLMYGAFRVLEGQAAANDPQMSPLAPRSTEMPRRTTASPAFGVAKGPQLLTNEPAALRQQREAEQQQLTGYGWVNQQAGVARMPIEEAKKLIVERGLPARADRIAAPMVGTTLPARGESSSGRVVTQPPAGGPTPPAAAPAPQKPATPEHKGDQ